MGFSKTYSAQANLISAQKIDIETDISHGLYAFNIVGLGDKSVGESKDRVSSAIKYAGFKSPKQKNRKIVISLAPAHEKKTGSAFDLPIAIGYLLATREINFDAKNKLFIGELSLNGEVRKTTGIMQITKFAQENNFSEIYLPADNAGEASFIKGIKIFAVQNLTQLINHLTGQKVMQPLNFLNEGKDNLKINVNKEKTPIIDFAEIVGHETAKRGLLIAASGGHNVAFYGPPGTGKTMLARAFSGILPKLDQNEIIETTSIHSISGILKDDFIIHPPFRSPHHTSSYSAIVGGGLSTKPGEITLAHNGVLFLDELPEFDRRVINALREPLEEKKIAVSRVGGQTEYPANFIFISAMNPCACGYYKTNVKECSCTQTSISHYQRKIPGPIIDRIDLWIEVNNVGQNEILNNKSENLKSQSGEYKNIVKECRKIQIERFKKLNSEITNKEIKNIDINAEAEKILFTLFEKYKLSMRSFYKILKIARTIADLDNELEIKKPHILEAIQFRQKRF